MQDLTLVQLKQAYDAALEQISAESFLQKGMPLDLFIKRLQLGNNLIDADPTKPDLIGKLRMTQSQAEAFVSRYQIIDAYQDDATGFSAVALRDTKGDADPTNDEVIIAVRSTEFNLDRPRDVATDIQIEQTGFAFDQILALQAFKDLVLSQNPDVTNFSLVGYSLSGNVVRTLAAMYPDEVKQAAGSNIVFNATGMGNFIDPTGQNRPRDVVLREMMTLYRTVEEDPSSADPSTIAANVNLQALYDDALDAPPLDLGDPDGNVYTNARVAFAQTYIATVYGTSYDEFFDQTAAEPAFTQYYGHALSGFDTQAVANSGIHPDPIGIPIEGQPVLESLFNHKFDFLNTHSLTLMADSLRLMILFKEVDPNITTDTIEAIFKASSNAKAELVSLAGDPNAAEGDTLEKALDALRAVFIGPDITPTPSDAHASAFGDIDKRTTYYNNIAEVETAVSGQTFTIVSLASLSANDLRVAAESGANNGDTGLAFRYALQELNPFAVLGADYSTPGKFTQFDASNTGYGFTDQYIQDRAEFLADKIAFNIVDGVDPLLPFPNIHFKDFASGYEIAPANADKEIFFGGNDVDPIPGGDGADYLFGGMGNDAIMGESGDDYLEGNQGEDMLMGGTGFDTYVYRINDGQDTIIDSDGQGEILYDTHPVDGGIRKDTDPANTYRGGAQGAMTYVWDGTDLIINNLITVQGFQNGELGIQLTTVPDTQISQPTIDFSNTLPLRTEFWGPLLHTEDNGSYHWYSWDQITIPTNDAVSYYSSADPQNGPPYIELPYSSSAPPDFPYLGDAYLDIHLGNGGNEIVAGPGADRLVGGNANDSLFGLAGNDQLFGGEGDDYLRGETWEGTPFALSGLTGDDFLDGGPGNDWLLGGYGNNVLLGGAGNDELHGGREQNGDDYLDGGDGNDTLKGFGGNDMLIGGEGDDTLMGDNDYYLDEFGQQNYSFLSPVPGDDVFDGGAGNDILIGNTGTNVILFGRGSGQDMVSEPDNVAMFERVHYSGLSPEDLQGTDIIQFGDDVSPGDVTVREDTNLGLVLSITGTTDQITLSNFFSSSFSQSFFSQVIQVAFADGTVWGESVLNGPGVGVSDVITAGPGNNMISAGGGDDTIIGGAGNDTLDGGRGNDTYAFNLGDGVDTIIDTATAGEGNAVAFGDAITPDSLSLGLGSLLIQYGNQGDAIHITNFDPNNALGTYAIDTFQFADGTVLSYGDLIGRGFDLIGTDGDDVIIGTNVVDRIMGLGGSDTLIGGAGDDTYRFNLGDGVDTIYDASATGEGNSIQFGAGITQADLAFVQAQQVLTIAVGSGGDAIQLAGFDPSHSDGSLVVSTLHFADGSSITMSDLFPRGVTITGTEGDDILTGTPNDDSIFSLGGNDQLDGGSGDDILIGGAGNDELVGGAGNDVLIGDGIGPDGPGDGGPPDPGGGPPDPGGGLPDPGGGFPIGGDPPVAGGNDVLLGGASNDIYVFNLGDGVDTIHDVSSAGEGNGIVFGDGITQADLIFTPDQSAHTLIIAYGVGGDAIQLADFDPNNVNGSLVVKTVQFIDGSSVSLADLFVPVNTAPTVANPLADLSTPEDQAFSFVVPADAFVDQDAGDTLTYSATQADGSALPGWLAFDAPTGTFSGTPGNGDVGTINLTLTATDQGNLSAADTFALTVTNVNDAPTVAQAPADQSTLEDAAFSFVVPADIFVDQDAGDTLVLSASLEDGSALPAWLSFDAQAGAFSGAPTNDDVGMINVTVTATDSGNLSAADTFALTVANVNDAPTVANLIADQTAVEDAPFSFQAPVDTFADVDAGDVLTYSALLADGNALPGWLGFDAATRTFSGMPSFDDIGTVGVTVAAMDSGGLSTADTFALTVRIAPDQVVVGTDGDDVLKTSSGNDVIDARGGNDTVTAGRGNDTITGGMGNDLLNGGTGNDIYIYGSSDGLDQMTDQAGVDMVSFGAGISFDNTVARLTTAAGITTAHLRLLDAGGSELPDEGMDFVLDAGGVSPIERFAFANGTTFALSDLVIQTKAMQGTNGSDVVRTGRHDDVIEAGNGDDRVYAGTGHDTVYAGNGKDSLYGEGGNDALCGANGEDFLDGGGGNDLLDGGNGKDTLQGGPGDDALDSGNGADTILFGRGDGRDTLIGHGNNQGDAIRFSSGINPIDLVLSRQANDLRVAIHGSDDRMTIQDWYAARANQAKEFQAGSESVLHDQKVDQLIQAMAQFSSESGLSWDQAIDQRPQDVQTILAASWQ